MDVLQIIKNEHREVARLIDQANDCEPGDERLRELAKQIEAKLSLHLQIEERLFYAELRDRAEQEEEQVDVFEAYTEHAVAKALMQMLQSGRKPDEKFKAELQVLGESVKHHVEEEESKVFDLAKEYLDDEEREEIGESWERSKARAQSRVKVTRGTTASRKRAATSKAGGSRSRS